MTKSSNSDASTVLDAARRAWFRAGVRRRDRRLLAADLAAELAAAGSAADVLGDDPAGTARDWARARGMTDRRLRLAVLVVPALLAGVVGAGAVLMALADAFATRSDGGSTVLGDPRPAELLMIYGVGGLLAIVAMIAAVGALLRMLGDASAVRTMRALALSLPIAALVAAFSAVLVAQSDGYAIRPRTVLAVAADVLVVVSLGVAAARRHAVR